MGASSMFHKVASPSIPLDTPVRSWEELKPIIDAFGVMTSMDSVLRELYRKPPLSEPPTDVEDEWAIRFSYGNTHKPQYYFHTLQEAATVVHIITGGEFWFTGRSDIGKLKSHHVRSSAYTNGMLWCSTNPNWTWKTGTDDTIIRCSIDLPKGTQVVIDRSPVYGTLGQCLDGERLSLFPDVLLLPGEFRIGSVRRYKTEDFESDDDEDFECEEDKGEILGVSETRPSRTTPLNDREFAQLMLESVNNFIDVRLKVVRTMCVADPSVVGESRTTTNASYNREFAAL